MILMTEQWMKENNKRLSFDERIDLPLVDEWFICRSFKSEEVFEQVWQIFLLCTIQEPRRTMR